MEKWVDIKGYEGYYQISNMGRVKSLERFAYFNHYISGERHKRLMKESIKKKVYCKGYCAVSLCKNGVYKSMRVCRLVAMHFIPNPQNKPEVNHKDGIKDNDCAENLEWVTKKENAQHALKTGLIVRKSGS